MAQFTVYQNKNKSTQSDYPFLLNIQTDLLSSMQTCVVVPLMPLQIMAHAPMTVLTPILPVQGRDYCMLTPQLAGIHKRELGEEIEILSAYQYEIVAAIDFLLSGV